MTQQTPALLRSIWSVPLWRDEMLKTSRGWILNDASRSDVKGKLKTLFTTFLSEQAELHPLDLDTELINWEQLTEFLCTCFHRNRLRASLPAIPSDDLWVELSDEQCWGPLSLHPQQNRPIKETVPVPLFPLEHKLLTYGGARMIYRFESDLAELLKSGRIFNEAVEFFPGEAGNCHHNSANLWNENRAERTIATGYALSKDNMWRQHSWLIQTHPTTKQCSIIETTLQRIKYFGITLTSREAQEFYEMNG